MRADLAFLCVVASRQLDDAIFAIDEACVLKSGQANAYEKVAVRLGSVKLRDNLAGEGPRVRGEVIKNALLMNSHHDGFPEHLVQRGLTRAVSIRELAKAS